MNKEQKYFYDLLPGDMPNVDAIKISQYMANQSSLTPKSIRDSVEEIETLRIAAWDGWLGAANAYRSYPDQKHTFTDYWTSLGEVKAKALIKSASLKPNKLSDSEIQEMAEEYINSPHYDENGHKGSFIAGSKAIINKK